MDIDRNAPATKSDLLDLRQEFKQDLLSLKDELVEAIHDGQTELLRTFYGFTQTVQARFRRVGSDRGSAEAAHWDAGIPHPWKSKGSSHPPSAA